MNSPSTVDSAALLPDSPCYLDGAWSPLSCAQVSVMDRGFIFGDGVYEVIPVHQGRLFRFDEHMERLERSLAAIRIPNPHDRDGWLALLRELVRRTAEHLDTGDQALEQLIYLQVTRGVAMRQHLMLPGLKPTVFAMSQPFPVLPAEWRHHGVSCITAADFRWERGDIKSTSLLGNVMARQLADDHDAAEVILLREHGHGRFVTEGSLSNVWIVLEDALIGVPPSHHTLEGVRIDLLRELAEDCGIACHIRPIGAAELNSASEILLSSAGRGLLAVTRLDGEPVGHGAGRGRLGPVYGRLVEAYRQALIDQSI